MKLMIIANWMQELSGGDRILIELCKRWRYELEINFIISKDGWDICNKYGLVEFNPIFWVTGTLNKYGRLINYFYRSIVSVCRSFFFRISGDDLIIYSASDFLPDSIPAFVMKLKNPKIKWIAGFYLFAPKPWDKNSPYKGIYWFIGFFYWLSQLPVYWIVKKYTDMVFVTSEPDVKSFITKKRDKSKIVVIRGGVDISKSNKYLNSKSMAPLDKRKYDACFIGRFHYQKGVLELIDIWKLVTNQKKYAKLVMIACLASVAAMLYFELPP